MSLVGSAPGLDTFVGDQQWARSTQTDIYTRMGRRPSAVPAHLSRVLYIPWHNNNEPHLPIYDVHDKFTKAVGDAPMGASIFTTKLSMMKRPLGDGMDGDVQYLVNIHETQSENGKEFEAKVQKRELTGASPEATLVLPASTTDFSLKIASTNPYKSAISVKATSPTVATPAGPSEKFPYFSFTIPSSGIAYEWQVHPSEHGSLRYTLVALDKDSLDADEPVPFTEDNVVAIYHHVGIGSSLALTYSEGVLMLPEGPAASSLELATVTSLLGMLWRLRVLDKKAQRSNSRGAEGKEKKSFFKRTFGKD